jgi:hypothetical protein
VAGSAGHTGGGGCGGAAGCTGAAGGVGGAGGVLPFHAGAGGTGGVLRVARSSLMRISSRGLGGDAHVAPANSRLPSCARAVSW